MASQLDIDDVVADHPLAKAELERLRAALERIAEESGDKGYDMRNWAWHALHGDRP